MAIYKCQDCEQEEFVPRRFRYHIGPATRCPVCGTYRVSKLKVPDRIDKFHGGFLNLLERLAGKGMLFHCRWCRLQFYDRRPLARELAKLAEASVKAAAAHAAADQTADQT
jgi:DNA-directed RNA polymerase subunit RPC12/RpoP